jgi:hypothetical protein
MPEFLLSDQSMKDEETLLYIQAVMLWPHDAQMREAAYGIPMVENMLSEFSEGRLRPSKENAELLSRALWYPSSDHIREEADRLLWHGYSAGAILYRLLYADAKGVRDSIRNVVTGLSDYFHAKRIRESTINHFTWPTYRPVAHLWAAHLSIGQMREHYTVPCCIEDLPLFLALSERNRIEAEEVRLPRSKSTLLPAGETWRVPEGLSLPALSSEWCD